MMKDIAQKVQTIVAPFTVALAQWRQPMAMNDTIQAAHRRESLIIVIRVSDYWWTSGMTQVVIDKS